MGLLDRFKKSPTNAESSSPREVTARVLGGDVDLEIVGESFYQDALWAICGGDRSRRIRRPVIAVLVPQPENQYDANAIAVQVEGNVVGHLSREMCAQYGPGLQELMSRYAGSVALRGVIVGGAAGGGRAGTLGVWLEHDPSDFGLVSSTSRSSETSAPVASSTGAMRTGFSEAWLTDVEDDTYDLSWFNDLSDEDVPAIGQLRQLLETDPDPIDRHFQFAELESRLYRLRGDAAELDEYDEVCRHHDAEMKGICHAFMTKWGKIPLLETYRQMAIRQQKKGDWAACSWWAERGLELYGESAARPDAVADLEKRRDRARLKLEAATKPPAVHKPATDVSVQVAQQSSEEPVRVDDRSPAIEVLTCARCGRSFERMKVRGRKPSLCPDCRSGTG